jgi:hypothetical protein
MHALGRLPSDAEIARITAYLDQRQQGVILQNTVSAAKAADQEAWSNFYQALFACAEFRYIY